MTLDIRPGVFHVGADVFARNTPAQGGTFVGQSTQVSARLGDKVPQVSAGLGGEAPQAAGWSLESHRAFYQGNVTW